jgi:hypothetical protein
MVEAPQLQVKKEITLSSSTIDLANFTCIYLNPLVKLIKTNSVKNSYKREDKHE